MVTNSSSWKAVLILSQQGVDWRFQENSLCSYVRRVSSPPVNFRSSHSAISNNFRGNWGIKQWYSCMQLIIAAFLGLWFYLNSLQLCKSWRRFVDVLTNILKTENENVCRASCFTTWDKLSSHLNKLSRSNSPTENTRPFISTCCVSEWTALVFAAI